MRLRWLVLLIALFALFIALAATAAASTTTHSLPARSSLLRRCENDYSDEELAAIWANGDDGYEPDDCLLLSNTLTGPELHNFCQPGDEDWVTFPAQANQIYQIKAAAQSNYPTEPHLDLIDNGVTIAQNDHYFGNDAEIWWWNDGPTRRVSVRVTELRDRFNCGNSEYTLSLHAFTDKP